MKNIQFERKRKKSNLFKSKPKSTKKVRKAQRERKKNRKIKKQILGNKKSIKNIIVQRGISISDARKKKWSKIALWVFQISVTCMLAFVFVWFWGQRVSNIGNSMSPVLDNGDVVLVDRVVYNASRPKRNDIIVFKPNGNENANYSIKRIIGLPGETVEIRDEAVYIDGEKLAELPSVTETITAGVAEEPVQLAGDEFFVMGDNRSGSEDSRSADIGNVKRSEIYGKIWFRSLPLPKIGIIFSR